MSIAFDSDFARQLEHEQDLKSEASAHQVCLFQNQLTSIYLDGMRGEFTIICTSLEFQVTPEAD